MYGFFFLVCCCCIVQSKSRLGRLVHQKKATCVALTDINTKDESEFNKLVDTLNTKYKSRFDEIRRSWGGQQLGHKTMAHLRQMAIAKELELNERRKVRVIAKTSNLRNQPTTDSTAHEFTRILTMPPTC